VIGSDAAIAAALRAVGIIHLPVYRVKDQVSDGTLVPILREYSGESLPIHLLHRESRFGSSKVRNFIDLIADRLRAEPSLH